MCCMLIISCHLGKFPRGNFQVVDNNKLLGAKDIATGSKDATRGSSWPYY